MKSFRIYLAPLAAALILSGCPSPKTVKKDSSQEPAAPTTASEPSSQTQASNASEANLRGSNFVPASELESIYFNYDSYNLDDAARKTLKANADFLKSHSAWDVLTAGNCDERGTIAYNLALGQKRAQTVREYYIRLGIPAKKIATISYGKEKPICNESSEECWSKNRRTDTLVRGQAGSQSK